MGVMKILGWVEVQKLGKVELSSGLGEGLIFWGVYKFFTRSKNMVTIFKVGRGVKSFSGEVKILPLKNMVKFLRSGRGLIGLRLVEELIL